MDACKHVKKPIRKYKFKLWECCKLLISDLTDLEYYYDN